MSAELALAVPLPTDRRRWRRASEALAAGDLDAFADHATAAHQLPAAQSESVLAWWHTCARQ
jgi:hypothetical protein